MLLRLPTYLRDDYSMTVTTDALPHVVYDKDLADSFLFPESSHSTHSEHRFKYVETQYPFERQSDRSLSMPLKNEKSLMKNVACVARFLKKAQDKGLRLEELLDDVTADSIISFLTESTCASTATGFRCDAVAIKAREPFHLQTDGIVRMKRVRKAKSSEYGPSKADIPPPLPLKANEKLKLVKSRNMPPSKAATTSGCPDANESPEGTNSREEHRTNSDTGAMSASIVDVKPADTIRKSLSKKAVAPKPPTSKKRSRSRKRRSEAEFSKVLYPGIFDMLDPPDAWTATLPAVTDQQKGEDTTTARNRSFRRPFYQPLKRFLHSNVKERRWYNDQVRRVKHAIVDPEITALLANASIHPLDLDGVVDTIV